MDRPTSTDAPVPDQSANHSTAVDQQSQQQSAHSSNATSNLGLDALLLQHSEIGDWSAIVDKQIIENPLPLENDSTESKAVAEPKKISSTGFSSSKPQPPAELRYPFYAYVYGVNFAARKVDIFYFFGGSKNVADLHLYTNNAQQQPRFNGDCLILATGFESLIEVLRKDGEELMGRKINIDYVNPTNQDRKKYSQQQLDNARNVPVPVISYNQSSRGNNYNRQDSSRNADQYSGGGGGNNQNRSSYSPRGAGQQQTSPSSQSNYQQKQQLQDQQRRSKFMPNKVSNDVRSIQPGGQTAYNQNQRPPPAAVPSNQYDRQSSYQKQRSNAPNQAWSSNENNFQQQQGEDIHPAPVVVKKADIFGAAKPVNTAKREQEIAAKLAEERMLAKEAQLQQQQQNAYGVVPPANQQQPQQFFNTHSNSGQAPRHSMGSNNSSQQSIHQPQVRILKHASAAQHQQQRKQSISEAHPVPLNQCHPSTRESVEAVATPNQETTETNNQWSPELPQEEEVGQMAGNISVARQSNVSGRGYGRGARSGSESSSNFNHQQRPRNNNQRNNREQHKDGHHGNARNDNHYNRDGGRFNPPSQQPHGQYHDQRGGGESTLDRNATLPRSNQQQRYNNHQNHHRSNNNVSNDEALHRQGQQGHSKSSSNQQRSPPRRLGKGQIDIINKLVTPDQQQGAKPDSKPSSNQQQPHSKGPPFPSSTHGGGGHGHARRVSHYVNSNRGEGNNRTGGEGGGTLPRQTIHARMSKKQSMDSKMDDSAREELQHNKHYPKAGPLRQGRSDSTPNVVTGSKASVNSEVAATASKNVAVPASPIAATIGPEGVEEGPSENKQPSSAAKKNNKKKSNKKDVANSSTVATKNKFGILVDESM